MWERQLPVSEILFAAKTGFLSKELWLKFFTTRSISQNSRLWRGLVSEEFFKPHESKVLSDVVVLGKRGKLLLESMGVSFVSPPHMNQIEHDVKAATMMQGLLKTLGGTAVLTEAELKKRFADWIKTNRDGKLIKFPDLLVDLGRNAKFEKVALEVELSQKNPERYRSIMLSYSSKSDVDAIVFISDKQTIFDSLSRAASAVHFPTWNRPIGYGEVKDWTKDPMNAPIHMSNGVWTLSRWQSESLRTPV